MDNSDCWQALTLPRSVADISLRFIKLCCICTIMTLNVASGLRAVKFNVYWQRIGFDSRLQDLGAQWF